MKLITAPLHDVADLVARHHPSHIISLASPGPVDAAPPDAPLHRLDLRFNDIAAPREGLRPPSQADVAALLTFAESWHGERPMLIHCWAGVSRSTAATYVIACARSAPGREAEWAEHLRAAAPTATPNSLIVALADHLLERGGAMTRAVAAIGRGAETAWGAPFELNLSSQGASRR